MGLKISFYGSLGDCIGRQAELELPSEGCTVAELRKRLAATYPDAKTEFARPSLRACVDDMIVGEDHRIRSGQSVEFFPPLSGG